MSGRRFFPVVRWILGVQALWLVLLAVVGLVVGGTIFAGSALLGGLIAFLPNLFFSLGLGVRDDRRTARHVARLFYGGEVLKLLMTVILFTVAFQLPDIQLLPLMMGFIGALSVFWFALWVRGSVS